MATDVTELTTLARRWLACFDTHDVDTLVSLYAPDARHYSPKLRVARPETGGCIEGRSALRDWWSDAFRRLPALRYEETRIAEGDEHVVLEYLRHVPGEPSLLVAEVFVVKQGMIVESRVYHG